MSDAPLPPTDATRRCPLPVQSLDLDALTLNLCRALDEAGCPLAPPVQQRLRFETLLAELSATFVHLPAGQVDSQIEFALCRVVEFLGVDRGGLAEWLAGPNQLVLTHSYQRPGVPGNLRADLNERLPWYARTIQRGEVLRLAKLPDDLPPEAAEEREYCARIGMKAHVMIPLRVMESVVGAIGFASFRRSHDWPEDLIQRLRLIGEIFANALARKRAEEREHQLRDQLARVARVTVVGELTAAIAHEVNQPLCAIVSNAQAAQRLLKAEARNGGEVGEILQDVTADALRASAVIARIRALLQNHQPVKAPLDLNDAISDVVHLAQRQPQRKRHSLTLQLAADLPPAWGDRVQLQQVVLNLLRNALEAGDHNEANTHEVSVSSAHAATGELLVHVCDSGLGIAPEHLGRVFEPFFTTKPGGIGVGLAISRSIIEAHGGKIWAVSTPGCGTTFTFTLPASKDA